MKMVKYVALAAVSLIASTSAQAGTKKVLFLGAENSTVRMEAEKNDILSGDTRFDIANSAGYDISSSGIPTLSYLNGFDAVLLSSNAVYDFTAVSNLLADYVDAGHGVVISTFWGQESNGQGRLNSPTYNPLIGADFFAYDARQLGAFNAADPLMNGVSFIYASTYSGDYTTVAAGATLAASWNDGRPLAAYNAAHNVANITLFPNVAEYNHASGDYRRLFANGLDFVSGGAGAVPEPATWAMMIGGFGMVGGAMRRRRTITKVSFA